jgi:cellulose synthase/poly-beta-1,6-N-acetylglucosamine synthase-like glycosyltransferase
MSAPAVSVVLPFRDAASTLVTLDSLRQQTLDNWEALLVDDQSNDAGPEQAAQAQRQDPRFRCLRSAEPGGLVPALNTGLAAVRSPLIARLDADDVMHPDRLRKQVSFLKENPDIGLVGCGVAFGGDPKQQRGYAEHVAWTNSLTTPEAVSRYRFVESPFPHPSVCFRRELVDTYGGYRDGPFPEDYELWLRWLNAGVRMAKVPETLLTWNDPPERLSRTDNRYSVDAFFATKAPYLRRWLDSCVDPTRPIWIWGAGRATRKRLRALADAGIRWSGWIDIDPAKIGQQVDGLPVHAPEALATAEPRPFVLTALMARGARQKIEAALAAAGFKPERDYLCIA